jgi:alkanesulfonate monooxygenase SsuD/methylene tetrahydromethanopterin reductase-like flavin-dependent oxidoreductase (luciferase family)
VFSPRTLRDVVAVVETAGFTLVTFADSPVPPSGGLDAAGRLEAVSRAAYVSILTDRVGLAPTAHVTTTEPFHLATQLASLDHASRGRAAWVVGAVNTPDALATVGAKPFEDKAALRREVSEVVDVAQRLWDSWEDDSVIRDTPTGRFLDPDKVHHVDFEGTSFSIKGPLITPRPPQGQVVVIASQELGIDQLADIVLVSGEDVATVVQRTTAVRSTSGPQVFAEIEVVLDAAEAAADRLARLDTATPWEPSGRLRHVGSAAQLARLIEGLGEDVDGIRLHPAVLTVDLPALIDGVLPILDAAGRTRRPQPGATLRQTLGLPHPANRFAEAQTRPLEV